MNKYYNLALSRANLPHLTVAQRVVDKIVANALLYETETGEALVGLTVKVPARSEPDIYVLDTISPLADTTVREGAYFEQGDDTQGDIFNWWADNWERFRERRRASYGSAIGAKWDVPLANLGDWHKHPGTLTTPSSGDFETAYEHIFDDQKGIPQLLVVLATVWDRTMAELDLSADPDEVVGEQADKYGLKPHPLKIPISGGKVVRIDFWYMSRHTRRFVKLKPIVTEDSLMPNMPVIGWHIVDYQRFGEELNRLSDDGYSILRAQAHNADDVPPLEFCVQVFRMTGKYILTIVTAADYPNSCPKLRYTPIDVIKEIPDGGKPFLPVWNKSQPVPDTCYPDWQWSPEHHLSELVKAVEAKLTPGAVAAVSAKKGETV
ncbi:MAG: hypothetical protein KF726_09395 [Anaerolineae bacterium]|nr:hypothetical protein [Anaerolineae bacterium]